MRMDDLRICDDGQKSKLDAAKLRGIVTDRLFEYRKAGEPTIFFDTLLPDFFVDAAGEPVDVSIGEALDMILR